ncbi:phosphopyruvate hydratase [Pasteuria penetrans]|uniref:phosphopyruvate hydratase n=1 Tax=Pasteuria penetrans TaxID=86005 RepID=UPI000FB95B46|nr:phosphopyruvate hydratase [Pasteuria penetrans]
MRIQSVSAREILDSRGQPTVEATVRLEGGIVGAAMVPSGASTGAHEAVELRDGDENRYGGRGVLQAVRHVEEVLGPAVAGLYAVDQSRVDAALLAADGTPNKGRLGANALLAVSLATARAAACAHQLPLWRYMGGLVPVSLPVPMLNILNGGAHADNNVDVQEFMVVPLKADSFREALRMGVGVRDSLRVLLREKGLSTGVGDEGGFAPNLSSNEMALQLIVQAIERAGYRPGLDVVLALDVAATEWYREGFYHVASQGTKCSSSDLMGLYTEWIKNYPIVSIEDGLAEDDWEGWGVFTKHLGRVVQLVGDDLFVTQRGRLERGIAMGVGNALLVKPNQVGTLTETWHSVLTAQRARYATVFSHRSGETEDTFLADLVIACGSQQIKTGAPCRSERVAKYNRLLQIEEEAGTPCYAGAKAFLFRKDKAKDKAKGQKKKGHR